MELQLILKIAAIGLDVANQALGFSEASYSASSYGIEKEANQQLKELIETSNSSLKEAIYIGIDKVINKIEKDKLEELISRINNINLLFRIKRHEQLLPYVLQLRESVDYAKNRLSEGKQHWLMPYMIGLGMVCATFSYLGEQDFSASKELERLVYDTKKMVLDEVSKVLVKQGQDIPWDLVKRVLDNDAGAIDQYVSLLPTKSPRSTSLVEQFDTYEEYLKWFRNSRGSSTPFSEEEFYRSLRYSGQSK